LLKERKVRLDDRLTRFFHNFGVHGKTHVTFRHLLAHCSGLPGWRPFSREIDRIEHQGRLNFLASRGAKEWVYEQIHRERPEYEIGARSVYSDLGFMLLGELIELLSRMPLDRFCHERIFRPLGLRASAFVDLTAVRTRRLTPVTDLIAPTERCPWRQRILCGEVHDDNAYAMGGVAGHAGLFANAAEMSALAGLLRAAGHSVTGSDEHVYPPASTLLEELGIPVFHGYDPARVAGVDLVVCGNAVRRTNPEAEAAEAGGLRMLSMPAAVEEMFLAGRSPLVVAGTHGKTTSSAMLAWVLERTGRGPGFLVGGVPRELERSFA